MAVILRQDLSRDVDAPQDARRRAIASPSRLPQTEIGKFMKLVNFIVAGAAATLVLQGCTSPIDCTTLPSLAITLRVVDAATGRAIMDSTQVSAVQTGPPQFDALATYPGSDSSAAARIRIMGVAGIYDLTVQRKGYVPAVRRGVVVLSEDARCLRAKTVDLTISLSPGQ